MKLVINSKFIISILLVALCAIPGSANADNAIYSVKVNDLRYVMPEKKHNAGEVIGTVMDALAGEATNSDNSHLAPAVSSKVRSAFSAVRRLAPVTDIADVQFALSGDITSIITHTSTRTVERKDSKGKPYNELVNSYEASIGVTLTLTEMATGEEWTNSFSANTNWYEDPYSETNAFDIAAERLYSEIVKTYNSMFPLVAEIIEGGDVKKDKQKDVYIDLGAINGITKGQHFEVFELGSVAGREIRKHIGKLKVEEVMSDDISRCKVEKGAKEIKEAIDSGKTLLVTSLD